MAKVKVTGGMSNTWISDIRKSDRVKSEVSKRVERSVQRSNSIMKTRSVNSGFMWFYKVKKLSGKWGTTHLIIATNPISNKYKEVLNSSLLSSGMKRK